MILTVSNVERSLAFYEAALKPLNIKFFLRMALQKRFNNHRKQFVDC